ncbi:MAG: type IV pilin protein [Aquisalimonadaceae bacterium]
MRQQGFSFIEIMVVVIIIGIIAAVAFPSYGRYVEQSRRSEATSALTNVAQQMERCYTATASYQNCIADSAFNAEDRLPTESRFYEIAVDAPTTNTYTLTAVRVQADNRNTCGNLTLNHQGRRGVTNTDSTVDACW